MGKKSRIARQAAHTMWITASALRGLRTAVERARGDGDEEVRRASAWLEAAERIRAKGVVAPKLTIIERIERMRLNLEEGSAEDRAYRRGWEDMRKNIIADLRPGAAVEPPEPMYPAWETKCATCGLAFYSNGSEFCGRYCLQISSAIDPSWSVPERARVRALTAAGDRSERVPA